MRIARTLLVPLTLAIAVAVVTGCERKTTKKMTVDTPTKTVEIEVEKTERK